MKSTTDGHRHFTIAQRLRVSSEQVVRLKDSCSRMRKHSAAVCVGLRVSAAENEFNRRRTPTFCPADVTGPKRHALRAGGLSGTGRCV
jgi:hypothetical protein